VLSLKCLIMKCVTYVPGINCHPCLDKDISCKS
jgi:hypothetical protein